MSSPIACFDLTPFSSGSRFRGIGMFAYELARAMVSLPERAREGLDLRFLTGRGRHMRVDAEGPASVGALYDGFTQPAWLYQLTKMTFGRAALVTRSVDLYHAADPKGTPHLGMQKVVVSCHDIIPTLLGGSYVGVMPRSVVRLLDRVRYTRPAHVIAISHATRDDIVRELGITPESVSVVHLGVDHAAFHPQPEDNERATISAAVGTERPYFVYVGAFDPRKRVPEFLEAFSRVASRIDEDVVLLGRMNATLKASYGALINRLGIGRRVHMPGFVPRELLPALYRQATAHVLPSVFEGFGLTLVEAMASGCPVIARPVTAMPEICQDAAEWADAQSTEALEAALFRLASDPDRRAELRKLGIARAAGFTWARAAEQTLEVYRRVLSR